MRLSLRALIWPGAVALVLLGIAALATHGTRESTAPAWSARTGGTGPAPVATSEQADHRTAAPDRHEPEPVYAERDGPHEALAQIEQVTIIVDEGTEVEHIERGPMAEGRREGLWQIFSSAGELWMEQEFRDDQLDGVTRIWAPDGWKQQERSYQKGILHGPLTAWNRDGSLAFMIEYANGRKQGAWLEMYPGGSIKSRGNYQNDELDSYCEFFLPNGSYDLDKTGVYVNGAKVSDR